ncbi:Malate dehydrogenase, cytoplasmic, partial [Tulasnella sp. 417]
MDTLVDNMSSLATTSEHVEPDCNPAKDKASQNSPAASTSSFERLPIELFEEVITTVLSDPPAPPPSYYRQMMPLRLVSSVWARVIDHGAPRLWTTTSSGLRPQMVELALQRSQQAPLTIICGRGTSTPWGPEESAYQHLVVPHCHRWRHLRAEGTVKGKPLAVSLQPLLGRPLPQLEGLHVFVNAWMIPDAGESDEYPQAIQAPLLRSVMMVNCAVPSQSFVSLSGLRQLRIGTLHPGRFNPHYFPPVLSLSKLFDVLESSPYLVAFSLFGYNALVDSAPVVHRLTMSQLEVLRLNRVAASFILNVLQRLDTPRLKELEVEPSVGPSATDNQEELLGLVGSRIAATTQARSPTSLLRIKATAWEVKIGHGSSVFTGKRAWDSNNVDLLIYRPLMENLVSGAAKRGAEPLTALQLSIYDGIMIRPALTLVNEFLGNSIQKLAFLWFNIITVQDIDHIVECGIGQPLSLLLKAEPLVSSLSLYDIRGAPGVAADVSHVDTASQVNGYAADNITAALEGAEVVIIPAGVPRKPGMTRDDLFNTNASIVRDLAKEIAKTAPKANVLIISNPVNSTVPIVASVFKKAGTFDPKRLFGITTLDVVRASQFTSGLVA